MVSKFGGILMNNTIQTGVNVNKSLVKFYEGGEIKSFKNLVANVVNHS